MADVSDEQIRRQIGAIMSMSDEIDGDVMLKCLTELQARRAAEAKAGEANRPDVCPGDGMPCYVGKEPDDKHHRCGTVQCGRAALGSPAMTDAKEGTPVTEMTARTPCPYPAKGSDQNTSMLNCMERGDCGCRTATEIASLLERLSRRNA